MTVPRIDQTIDRPLGRVRLGAPSFPRPDPQERDPDRRAAALLAARYPQLGPAIVTSDRLLSGLRALRLASGATAEDIAAEVGARELDTAQRPVGVLVSRCGELVASIRHQAPSGPADLPGTTRTAPFLLPAGEEADAADDGPVDADDPVREPDETDLTERAGTADDGPVPAQEPAGERLTDDGPLRAGTGTSSVALPAHVRVPQAITPLTGSRPAPRSARAEPSVLRALTLEDLLGSSAAPPPAPPARGWQHLVHRATGGLLVPPPGAREEAYRRDVATVQTSFDGPRTVVVVNPKGGANKTTAALLLAATFGVHRGGYTLAWDNNETNGTLGWRARRRGPHRSTAVDLLRDLDRFRSVDGRVGDLDAYVRAQGTSQFDVLASDEDPASNAVIDATAFQQLHETLQRFYRVLVVDTGNNVRSSNWQAAVDAADQLVVVTTVAEDTAKAAAWLADALRAGGGEDKLASAVTVVAEPGRGTDENLRRRLHDHFGALTRAVVDVPYDRALVGGRPIVYEALTGASREAWLQVAVAVATGLGTGLGTGDRSDAAVPALSARG